jgi:membrane protein YqaA with SNARE-associated domain
MVRLHSLFTQENKMRRVLALLTLLIVCLLPSSLTAAPPGAAFNGQVSEIFVNDSQVLIAVSGSVSGSCTGSFGPYNLTFDLSDKGAEAKLALIRDAFIHKKTIAGFVKGCGSSNINKMIQVSVF